jgi:hypothetical protein
VAGEDKYRPTWKVHPEGFEPSTFGSVDPSGRFSRIRPPASRIVPRRRFRRVFQGLTR